MDINEFSIERSTGVVTASEDPLVVYNDVVPFSVALTDSGSPNTVDLGAGALAANLRLGSLTGQVLAQTQEFIFSNGVKTGRFVLGPAAQDLIFQSSDGGVVVEFILSEKTGPRLTYSLATEIDVTVTGSAPGGSGDMLSAAPVITAPLRVVPATMAALEIDVTKANPLLTVSSAGTITISATPAAGTRIPVTVTNPTSEPITCAAPTGWSQLAGEDIDELIFPPGTWEFGMKFEASRLVYLNEYREDTASGGTGGVNSQSIPVGACTSAGPGSAGATWGSRIVGTSGIVLDYFSFSNSAEQKIFFSFRQPAEWTKLTHRFSVDWEHDNGLSGNVEFGFATLAVRNNDTPAAAFGTEVNVTDTSLGDGKQMTTDLSGNVTPAGTLAAGATVYGVLNRTANGVAGAIRVINSIHIEQGST